MNTTRNYINIRDISQRQAARLAGFGLLFMFLSGIFAGGPDAASSFYCITASRFALRLNITGNLIMLVCDVIAALGLFVLLKPVNKSFSMLSAFFRLLHVAIYGASTILLLLVLFLLNGEDYLTGSNTDRIHDQMMLFLNGHDYGLRVGLIFFGFHLLVLGYLIVKSGYIPGILGISLIIVSFGYLANSFLSVLMPVYEDHKTIIQYIVFLPAMVSELALCLWLLFKSHKIPEVQPK